MTNINIKINIKIIDNKIIDWKSVIFILKNKLYSNICWILDYEITYSRC